MKETLERELKLSVKRGFEMPPLPRMSRRHLRATYYDTDDHRLARHVVTLRRRDEDGRDLWQLRSCPARALAWSWSGRPTAPTYRLSCRVS